MTNLTLKIVHDPDAQNPWTDWDCMPPLFIEDGTFHDSNGGTRWISEDYSLSYLLDIIPKSKYNKNLLALFGLDYNNKIHYKYTREDYTTAYDYIRECMESLDLTRDNIEKLASYAKIQYYSWTSKGYSQGDSLDCLLIGTLNGTIESLKQSASTWDAYAWGDVYGYEVIDTDGEIIDSLYGFYGLDSITPESIPESVRHLLDDAKNNIIF